MLHRYNSRMAAESKLSHTAAMILQAIHAGHVYGFSIMEMTGLPSGTVYPALRRLERDDLIRSHWEQQSIADSEQRPPRKYYKLTRAGRATLESSQKRYPLLAVRTGLQSGPRSSGTFIRPAFLHRAHRGKATEKWPPSASAHSRMPSA